MLSDVEVARYSRQILLRAVGGQGQEKLLRTQVQIDGSGEALSVTSRYLAASGTKVDSGSERSDSFPLQFAPQRTNQPATLIAMQSPGEASELPGALVGSQENRLGILFWTRAACRQCLSQLSENLSSPPPGALSSLAGALAAWMLQRLALGMSEDLGGVWIAPPANIQRMSVPPCSHRA